MFETYLTAVGRLITPVQEWIFPDGTVKASFRMACNERRYDQASDAWADGQSLYLSVTCWRALATHVKASLNSGDPVIARGRLFTRHYDKDGRRNYVVEMDASAVGPDLARSTAVVSRGDGTGQGGAATSEAVTSEAATSEAATSEAAVSDAYAPTPAGVLPAVEQDRWPGNGAGRSAGGPISGGAEQTARDGYGRGVEAAVGV